MAYNRIQAERLLDGREMEVFSASLSDRIGDLAPRELQAMVRRTRTLRDKSQDLLQRQRVATRGRTGTKSGPSGLDNVRSGQKVQVLGEALQRFEKRLAQIEAANGRASRKSAGAQLRQALQKKRGATTPRAAGKGPSRSTKAPARSPHETGTPANEAGQSPRAARKAKQFEEVGLRSVQGHISSAHRRNQAKRDGRG